MEKNPSDAALLIKPAPKNQPFRTWFKRTLFAGLVVLVPLALTVYILNLIISTTDELLTAGPVWLQVPLSWRFPGSGLIGAVVVALIAGVIARNVIGLYLVQVFNRGIERIPLIASLYRLLRQLAETLLSTDDKKGFKTAVLVEWPRRDTWTIAFVASEVGGQVAKQLGASSADPYLNLFIPATPNPTSGFFFMAKRSEVRPLQLSVENAFKIVISGGTLSPD